MDIALKLLLVVFSIGLITVVLLQHGKSAGLAGAISGGAEHLSVKRKRADWIFSCNVQRWYWVQDL